MAFLRLLTAAIPSAVANTFSVSAFNYQGKVYALNTIVSNIITVLNGTIAWVCLAVFSIGALMFSIGPALGKSDWQSNGKGMMIAACIGAAIVVGANGILGLVIYFIYF